MYRLLYLCVSMGHIQRLLTEYRSRPIYTDCASARHLCHEMTRPSTETRLVYINGSQKCEVVFDYEHSENFRVTVLKIGFP